MRVSMPTCGCGWIRKCRRLSSRIPTCSDVPNAEDQRDELDVSEFRDGGCDCDCAAAWPWRACDYGRRAACDGADGCGESLGRCRQSAWASRGAGGRL